MFNPDKFKLTGTIIITTNGKKRNDETAEECMQRLTMFHAEKGYIPDGPAMAIVNRLDQLNYYQTMRAYDNASKREVIGNEKEES